MEKWLRDEEIAFFVLQNENLVKKAAIWGGKFVFQLMFSNVWFLIFTSLFWDEASAQDRMILHW